MKTLPILLNAPLDYTSAVDQVFIFHPYPIKNRLRFPKLSIKTSLLIITLVLSKLVLNAQIHDNGTWAAPNYTPHSPEASILGRFDEIPVQLNTGVPDISIPVYEIKIDNVTFPITLGYHASGVRVDDLSSIAGLGWALNAGSVINVVVNGNYDLAGNGWTNMTDSSRLSQTVPLLEDWMWDPFYKTNDGYRQQLDMAAGLIDTQPDLFYFSIPGYSGKFFFDQEGGCHQMPRTDCRIIFDDNLVRFIIIDPLGNKYIFGRAETVLLEIVQSCGGGDVFYNPPPSESYTFYLTRIETVKGEWIELDYSTVIYEYLNQVVETRYRFIEFYELVGSGGGEICQTNLTPCNSQTKSKVTGLRLNSITSSAGHEVQFIYSSLARKDVSGRNALEEILIRFPGGGTRSCHLFQSYFESDTYESANKYRLRLDSVQISGQNPYKFSYNPTLLPPRLSFSQDVWGLYNGVQNTTLLPQDNEAGFLTGADRSASEQYSKAGILERLIYPTGGYMEFEYELNQKYYEDTIDDIEIQDAGGRVLNNTMVVNFSIPQGASNFRGWWTASDGDMPDEFGNVTYITLTGGPSNINYSFTPALTTGINSLDFLSLSPGNYQLQITSYGSGSTAESGIYIYWDMVTPVFVAGNRPIGGLRIKSIKSNALSDGKLVIKKYDYTDPSYPQRSSAQTMFEPKFTYDHFNMTSFGGAPEDEYEYNAYLICRHRAQTSQCLAPLGTVQGGNVSYQYVKEYFYSDSSSNGYTQYEFENKGEVISSLEYPFPPVVIADWLNGLPVSEKQYRSSGMEPDSYILERETSRSFFAPESLNEQDFVLKGAKVCMQFPARENGHEMVDLPAKFEIEYYHLRSSRTYLASEHVTEYPEHGTPLVTRITYYYDNADHCQPTRIVKNKSNAAEQVQANIYPGDYTSPPQNLADLKENNLVALPIEQVIYEEHPSNNHYVKSGILYDYKPGGKGLLNTVFQLENNSIIASEDFKFSNRDPGILYPSGSNTGYTPDARYEINTSFNSYSSKGRVQEIVNRNGLADSYIWNHEEQYPICKVQGATFNEIAYTSFETVETGSWVLSDSNLNMNDAFAGRQSYILLPGEPITRSGIITGKRYIVSYWSKSGSAMVNGVAGNSGASHNGWMYWEHVLPTTTNTLTLSGNNIVIDELRLYPEGAQMTTYTYEPMIGMTSETDPSGRIIYYEYDASGRLSLVRDVDSNIVRRICYNYAGQPVECTPPMFVKLKYSEYQPLFIPSARLSAQFFSDVDCTMPATATNVDLKLLRYDSCTATYDTVHFIANGHEYVIDSSASLNYREGSPLNFTICNYSFRLLADESVFVPQLSNPPLVYLTVQITNRDTTGNDIYADLVVKSYTDSTCNVPVNVHNLLISYLIHNTCGATNLLAGHYMQGNTWVSRINLRYWGTRPGCGTILIPCTYQFCNRTYTLSNRSYYKIINLP